MTKGSYYYRSCLEQAMCMLHSWKCPKDVWHAIKCATQGEIQIFSGLSPVERGSEFPAPVEPKGFSFGDHEGQRKKQPTPAPFRSTLLPSRVPPPPRYVRRTVPATSHPLRVPLLSPARSHDLPSVQAAILLMQCTVYSCDTVAAALLRHRQ